MPLRAPALPCCTTIAGVMTPPAGSRNSVYPGIPAVFGQPQGIGLAALRLHCQARGFHAADSRQVHARATISTPCTRTRLVPSIIPRRRCCVVSSKSQSLDRATAFMIGDRHFDMEAARANRVTSIAGHLRFTAPFEELQAAGPDYSCLAVEDIFSTLISTGCAGPLQT